MFVQLRVGHGDGRLLGHRKRQGGVVGRKEISPGMRKTQYADEPSFYDQGHPHPGMHTFQERG